MGSHRCQRPMCSGKHLLKGWMPSSVSSMESSRSKNPCTQFCPQPPVPPTPLCPSSTAPCPGICPSPLPGPATGPHPCPSLHAAPHQCRCCHSGGSHPCPWSGEPV